MEQGDDVAADPTDAYQALVAGPPAPGHEQITRLDLFGALKFGVNHSREYQDKMEDLYLSALDVTLQRHLFEPRPFVRGGLEYTGGQGDVDYRSALAATTTAGVRQKLPYGGEIVAETLVKFVNAINGNVEDGESADIALSGSLPLLRGAGMVNLEPLIASERELVYQVRTFESYRRSFAVDIASRYFALLAAQQGIDNRLQNYATLASLLERAKALFAAKRFSFLEVQRAEQSLLAGENALIDARLAYANALDNFKIALGMNVNEPLDVIPVELDVTVPDIHSTAGVEAAYRYRLELQTARDRISDAVRRVEVAKNGLQPDLNLTGSASTGNRANESIRTFDSRTLTYSAGVQLDLPVDRLAERNAYRTALINFDRSQRGFEETRDQVTAQVRQDARGIRSAQSSLQIQRRSIDLAERRLELANERLRLGVAGADTREVVEAQEDLLNAQDAYERDRANLQIRVLEFLRDTGLLRVDPDAGELGRALLRDEKGVQADAGGNVDVNAGTRAQ
jgi:outer membrane protein TolC